jgi:mono/diheme cytochrome c family protein
MRWDIALRCAAGLAGGLVVAGTRLAGQTAVEVNGQRPQGQATYTSYCASCHGPLGKGDGPVAKNLKPPPADLTRLAQRNKGTFPADEVRKIIDGRNRKKPHGSQMPDWGNAFGKTTGNPDEQEVTRRIDSLVKYIESLQVTDPPAAGAADPR